MTSTRILYVRAKLLRPLSISIQQFHDANMPYHNCSVVPKPTVTLLQTTEIYAAALLRVYKHSLSMIKVLF